MLQRNTVVLSLPQTLKHNLIMNWIVPMRRLLGTLLLALLLSNCSGLFESEAERQQRLAQHFEQGMRLFEQKEYTGAVESFRQVPPESALYNRSLAMIRRVPYQRGRDAYEEQRYADASRQFRAVPVSAAEYDSAQNYLREIEMIRIEQQYRDSRGDRRRELLSQLVQKSRENSDAKRLDELLERSRKEMMGSMPAEQRAWLAWFRETMEEETSRTVRQQMLEEMVQNFEQFAAEPTTRAEAIELVASLKLSLQ